MTIRNARNKADRPAKQRPEGFARKVPSCGVARLVEQNERSTFVARLASEHFSCKRGSQRVLHQPARPPNPGCNVSARGRSKQIKPESRSAEIAAVEIEADGDLGVCWNPGAGIFAAIEIFAR